MATRNIVLELEVDESGAVKSLNRVEKEVDQLQEKTDKVGKGGGGLQFLEKISPKAASAVKGLTGNIGGLAGGFKTLRAAIISTGIGALVFALGSLVAFFTKTKRGAELLERATAALGAAMSVVIDRASALGEGIVNAFKDPKKAMKELGDAIVQNLQNRLEGIVGQVKAVSTIFEGLIDLDFDKISEGALEFASATQEIFTGIKTEDLINGLKSIKDEIEKEVEATDKLTKASQRLREIERNLAVETANRRAEIKELNKVAQDTTITYQERIRASEKANAIEENLLKRRLDAASENLRIIKAQKGLGESLADDLQEIADAEIALAGIRGESLDLQTTLQNRTNDIRKQQKAEELADEKRIADEQKRIAEEVNKVREFLDAKRQKSQEEKVNERFEKLREQANGETELLKELEINRQAELGQIKLNALLKEEEAAKASQERQAEDAKKTKDAKVGFAKATGNSLRTIATLIAGDNEKNARKIFAVNKALGIADAITSTYQAANQVLADKTLPTVAKPFAVGAIIAAGIANVAKIAATKFGGGASTGGSSRPSLGGGATASEQPTAAIDLSFQDQGQQEPIPAYILGDSIQGSQEARTRVNDLITL